MAGLWEFPGGKVKAGELPEAALVRELKEELAVDITESCLAPLTFASHVYADFHLLMPLYVCRVWKGTPTAKEGLKVVANLLADNMKKQVEGAFTIVPNFRKNQTMILHDNIPSKPGPGLFDKIFLHSQLPTGSIKQGQTWKDPVDNALMPTGLMEASTIDYKVPTVNATSIVVKAGFQVPIVKPPTVTDQKVTGSYAIAREYNFHRGGYLQSSKEDVTFAKKVDASGADAAGLARANRLATASGHSALGRNCSANGCSFLAVSIIARRSQLFC